MKTHASYSHDHLDTNAKNAHRNRISLSLPKDTNSGLDNWPTQIKGGFPVL